MYCTFNVYTKDIPCSIYNEYAWFITGISHPDQYMHGIYKVYIWYIKGIWCSHPYGWYIPCKIKWVCSLPFFIMIYLWYNDIPVIMFIQRMLMVYYRYIIIKKVQYKPILFYKVYIPAIWMRTPYAFDIPYIFLVYTMHIPVSM